MKNNKGFTLIELLAVIVVLAIIAMISTPLIMNAVTTAKDGAIKSSALGYVKGIENNTAERIFNDDATIVSGTYNLAFFEPTVKGTLPTTGVITIDDNGTITSASLCISNIKVDYNEGVAVLDKVGTCSDIIAPIVIPEPNPDVCFNFNSETGTINGYNLDSEMDNDPTYVGCTSDVSIPSSIGGVDVTIIGEAAMGYLGLTSVYIPDSVTTIGYYAFEANFFTTINIPTSVTSLAVECFNNNLLPPEQAFIYARNEDGSIDNTTLISYGGELRTDVTVPSNVEVVAEYALSYNDLISVIFPTSVTTIGDNALLYNLLTKITMDSGTTSLGSTIVSNWVRFEPTYASFGAGTYLGTQEGTWCLDDGTGACEIITTPEECFIFDPDTGIISSYDRSYNFTTCATDVTIPSTIGGVPVTELGANSISNLGITSVVIPNSIVKIGTAALSGNLLTSIIIPTSVTLIDAGAFNDNELPSGQGFIYQRNGDGSIDNTILASYAGLDRVNVVIPSNVTTIGIMAFYHISLTGVTIPTSVTNIGNYAFSWNLLTDILIPNSVTTIGSGAFSMNQLASVTIPNSVTSLMFQALNANVLTSITMNRTGTVLGNNVLNASNNNFKTTYTAGGAGTYVGTQAGTWTKQ